VYDTGNLSWLKSRSSSAVTKDKMPLRLRTDITTATTTTAAAGAGADDAMVVVNGVLVNLSSVLQNLSKSEEERAQTENELKSKQQECGLYHCLLFCCCLNSLSHFFCNLVAVGIPGLFAYTNNRSGNRQMTHV